MNREGFRGVGALALLVAVVCSVGAVRAVTSRTDEAVQSTEETQVLVPQVSTSVTPCMITLGKDNIHITADDSDDAAGTDGEVYLLEPQPYEDGIGSGTGYVTSTGAGTGAAFAIPLNHNTASDRPYSKFMMTAYDTEGKTFTEVNSLHHVTNPEAITKNQAKFKIALSKKGLNIELDTSANAFGPGVKHASTNIASSQLVGTGIEYIYNGKVYHFNKVVVDNYDKTTSAMSSKGMTVIVIILSDWNPATPRLVCPGTEKASNAFYYMLNATTQREFEETRVIAAFLTEHYNGSNPKAGKISNWVIGDETNNQQWDYMGPMDLANYIKTFQWAFCVFYTAIKSTNANDRVYFSLDYCWNSAGDNSPCYTGHEIMESFNAVCVVQGQMEWGLVYHPYPHPMTEPEFWDDATTGTVTDDAKLPVTDLANINVLTDYISGDAYKTPSGGMQHVILAEEGFTSRSVTRGDIPEIQATAYAYSYYLVDSNPYTDAYILNRQVDVLKEGDLRSGLWKCDETQTTKHVTTNRKKIWQVLRNIDKKEQTLSDMESARSIIGINKWSDVVPNFGWRSLGK